MTAKTSEKRTNAFFKALSETGNQTISAERACVSRSWVSLHRSTDPAFRARMEACISEARARLSGAGGVACAPVVGAKWGVIYGEELVLRGSNGRRAQVSRARVGQFTPRVEARFLSVLRRTCNVKMACVAVGVSAAAAYKHRDRWAEFERAWDAAIQDGYFALEMALLKNGIRALDPDGVADADGLAEEPALPMLPISADDAVRILGMRRVHVTGHGKRSGHRRPMPTEEETNASILKRLRVLAMRNARDQAQGQPRDEARDEARDEPV